VAIYQGFAEAYDSLMDNVPYDEWVAYICELFKRYGNITPEERPLILDMACGTGNITERMSSLGFDMIGIDNSEDMLDIANMKKLDNNSSALYLLQDMTEFELYGTVRAAISICDSVNYLLQPSDVIKTMKLVNNYLDPKGLFIFDFNTEHYFRDIVGENSISEARDDMAFIWDNYYDEEKHMNSLSLTLFTGEENGLYRRFDELHLQRGYTLHEMKQFINESGLRFEKAFDAFTFNEPDENSERICIIAREQGKMV